MIKWIAGIVASIIAGLILAWFKGELGFKKKPLPKPPEISQPKPKEKTELPEKPKPIPPKPKPSEQPLPPKAPPWPPSPKATPSAPRPMEPKEVPKTKAPSKPVDLISEGGILIGNPEKYPDEQSRKWPVQMFIVLNGKNESVEGTVIGPSPNDGVFYPIYVGLSRKKINPEVMAEIREQLRHR
ncbi:MAG: hypothetical protein Q8M54_01290 [Desulfobaccales bacterium]|nr:hypothetical protein [Desulfobaccales bacterium]